MSDPRPTCLRCRRPASFCYCALLTSIETRTRVLLLQHPRERNVAIGTARLASLCLPGAELHIGIDWEHDPSIQAALSDPERPAALLYPGEGAIDVTLEPPSGPVTLVVIDGTWPQSRKVMKQNPRLAALPRFSFTAPNPSEYRIRREPRAGCVSTVEALVHVLGALEREPERFRALLDPFRAMIDWQIDCEIRLRTPWARTKTPHRLARAMELRLPPVLKEHEGDLVCVTVEANAWPMSTETRSEELVYLVAERIGTGERLELMVAPRNALNPSTVVHAGIDLKRLCDGLDRTAFLEAWRSFLGDTDLLCFWGEYGLKLIEQEGGYIPPATIDLRRATGDFLRGKTGTMTQVLERLELDAGEAWGQGRAGERLGELTAIAAHLRRLAGEAGPGLDPTPD